VKVTVPPATVNSVADTWAVMVMTAPLDGLSGVVKSEVVVEAVAHAAGPADTNARAPNSTGIHRPGDIRREVMRRLNATMVDWVMSFRAPVRTV
jgi:predicted metal-dependent peptidase